MSDPLEQLTRAGVSIWLDDLSRHRLTSGNLARLVADRHVSGVTSNPTIFAAALRDGASYAGRLAELAGEGADVDTAVRALTTEDVRDACDLLRPVFDTTDGVDGRVSIEVDPRLAHDTDATLAEARALWREVDRPNLLVKIPATVEGLPAITAALAAGISVNVTLIFALERYAAVTEAWLAGLEQAVAAGRSPGAIGSVASFFVSRVDTEVDQRLDALGTAEAAALRGAAGIANARRAYAHYLDVVGGARWARLAAAGARPQRPLWASTGVKDARYDDTRYVVELVADGCVNTMPEATLDAVADHGSVTGDTVRPFLDDAAGVLAALAGVGVDYDDVVQVLEAQGVTKFVDSWEDLRRAVGAGLGTSQTAAGR